MSTSDKYPPHEGLQVNPNQDGLHVANWDHPEVVPENHPEVFKHSSQPEQAHWHQGTTSVGYSSTEAPNTPAQPQQRRSWFHGRRLLVLVALIALLIGAVIGGAVGGALANRNQTSSTTSQSTTSSPDATSSGTSPSSAATKTASKTSSTTSSAAPTGSLIPLDCPAINGTLHTTNSTTFQILCATDFTGGNNVIAGMANTFESCMDRCATYNDQKTDPGPCNAITWDGNLTQYPNTNCFLKKGVTGTRIYDGDKYQAGARVLT